MKASDLKANKRNPRKISPEARRKLQKSLKEFGDLSGIVFNVKDKTLYGGHQRVSLIPADAEIKMESKMKKANPQGTVGHGHIEVDGEKFPVRFVEWNPRKAAAAMIAANQHGGEWDHDLLRMEIERNDLLTGDDARDLLGFEDAEIARYLSDDNQAAAVEANNSYVGNEPAQAPAAPAPEVAPAPDVNPSAAEAHSAFDQVQEKTEIEGKRHVVIIDCPTQEARDALKEYLKLNVLEKFAGKIF